MMSVLLMCALFIPKTLSQELFHYTHIIKATFLLSLNIWKAIKESSWIFSHTEKSNHWAVEMWGYWMFTWWGKTSCRKNFFFFEDRGRDRTASCVNSISRSWSYHQECKFKPVWLQRSEWDVIDWLSHMIHLGLVLKAEAERGGKIVLKAETKRVGKTV